MHVTDRPGRYFALCVMAPALCAIGRRVRTHYVFESTLLHALGVGLFVYELFWVVQTEPESGVL